MTIIQKLTDQLDGTLCNIVGNKIAVAVSGGADSMALCFALHEWSKKHSLELTALTVDHQLRSESTAEAKKVHAWLISHNIHHEILTWQHETIASKVQELARDARYQLLINYCRTHAISNLFLGHHSNDQLETFMMRLSHQSGLKGLGGMLPVSQRQGVTILRPFLNLNPNEFKIYLSNKNQPWIEDPSNQLAHYERIRWRQQTSNLESIGLSSEIISNVCRKLHLEDEALEWAAMEWINNNTTWDEELKFIECNITLQKLPEALVKRIMIKLASKVRGIDISVADTRHNLNAPYINICTPSFKPFTFGGCYWIRHINTICLVREWDKCPQQDITSTQTLYDHRYVLKDLPVGEILQPISKKYWPLLKPIVTKKHLPYQVFLSLPLVLINKEVVWLDVYKAL